MVPVFNLKDSIVEALTALGGSGTASEVRDYIKSKYGKDWKDIEQVMDDLCIESESSFFSPEDRVLKRIGEGKYTLQEAVANELPETKVAIERPKPSAGDALHTTAKVALSMIPVVGGAPKEILEIKEEMWKKSIQETLNGVIMLLDSAGKFLDNGGNEAICAGLYTYAVEEYGKFLLLKQCKPSDGKVKIKYKHGFLNHDEKFKISAKALPEECKTLRRGLCDPKICDPNICDTESVVADFKARIAVFYCDFSDSGDRIKPVPTVDKELLKKAISKLQLITLGT